MPPVATGLVGKSQM